MFTVVTDSSVYMTRQEAEPWGCMCFRCYTVWTAYRIEGYAYENGSYRE